MIKRSQFWTQRRDHRKPIALLAFLLLVFAMGGSARADVQSLVLLRPLSVAFCCIALWTLTREDIKANAGLFAFAAAIFALVLVHLTPLPPLLWQDLPGHRLLTDIDKAAGIGAIWRPISIVPSGTWNALYALFVPFAALLLGAQLTREQRHLLLPVVLGIGLFSGLCGMLQIVADPDGPLYLYRITNNGYAVGLFANRNHQAALLASLFPMLAAFASIDIRSGNHRSMKSWAAIACAMALIPLILVTGSRAGLAVGIVGIVAAALLYRKPEVKTPKRKKPVVVSWRYPLLAFGVFCLTALTVMMSRAEALRRLISTDQTEDQRFLVWRPIADMAWKYFPMGSGIGSFVEAYQVDEPRELLITTYLNHAHNDFLEVYMTAGLPGLILVGIAVFAVARVSIRVFQSPIDRRGDVLLARLGAIVILIFALGSVTDYPLRTPSLSCLFVIAALWLNGVDRGEPKTTGVHQHPWLGD